MQFQVQAIISAALVFAATFGVGFLGLHILRSRRDGRETRLEALLSGSPSVALAIDSRRDPMPHVTRLFGKSGKHRDLQLSIVRAGLLLRPSELIAITAVGALVGLTVGYLCLGVLGASIGALLLALAPWGYVSIRRGTRKRALMRQLPNMLDLIGSSLRAGHGFSAGLKVAAEQTAPPLCDEIDRVLDELRLGLSLDEALDRLVERTDQPDTELMCAAVQIQTRTGGNLAEVLANISAVIRERMELQGELEALTAEGKISAIIMAVMPPIVAVVLTMKNPGWLDPLFYDILGNIILGVGAVMLVIGCIWMHRIVQMDI